MTRIALAGVLVLALAACAPRHTHPPLREDAYPGVLVDSAQLPAFFVRQRIEARYGERTLSFAAVLQSEGGVLSLLALTPYGTRAFLLEQRGQALSFVSYVDRALPFPPRFVMLDVHRALFRGADARAAGAPIDGPRASERDGERIREQWRGGKLLTRSFERLDGKPRGVIAIAYGSGMPSDFPAQPLPERIELRNEWFGYSLTIHTLRD